jgi:large repetitive protein
MTDRSDLDLGQQSGSEWTEASEGNTPATDQLAQATTSTTDSAAQPDEQPVVKSELNEMVIVDEDDLPNATGQQDSPGDLNPQFTTGTLEGSVGNDGPATFSLLETGGPDGYTYKVVGDVLTISDGAKPVLEVSLKDPSTGEYRVDLLDKIDHHAGPAPKFETNVDFTVTYRVTDADGDFADGTFVIRVNDDIPVSEEFETEQLTVEQPTEIDRTQVTQTIEASKTTPVILPEGAQIVAILANGNDLFIRLSDGSLIQITNGMKTIPTIVTSAGEITSESLTAALQANGVVLPAAGDEGPQSGGANLDTAGDFNLQGFDQNPLLPPTAFDREFGGFIETGGFIEENLPPVVGEPITITVSEEGLPDGNRDILGNNDTTNVAQVLNVPLPVSDPDGDPLTIIFIGEPTSSSGSFTSDGTQIVWSGVGTNELVGTAGPGGPLIITVTINPDNTVSVVLAGPLDHPFAGTSPEEEDQLETNFPISVSDGVNPPVATQVIIIIEDDSPNATATALTEDDVAVVDESSPVFTGTAGSGTDGVLSATINLANNFVTPAYGADGPGSVSYALVLTGDDVASGLFATDPDATDGKGDEILLNQTGNTITGTANGDTYFVISVDNDPLSPTFGSVTFTLSEDAPIWHEQTGANGTNHDDTSAMNVAAGLLVIEQTVTDADGDTATASVDLGDGVFQVQDDGPTAEATALTEDDVAVVDESSPVFTGTAGSGTDGVLSATINLANNFVTPAYGADGPGSVSYALVLTGDDVASGLFATDPDATDGKGDEILLNQTGNTITGTANGDTYFVISVDNDPLSPTFGSVTFTLSEDAPIWHEQTGANGTNHDDTSAMNVAAGLLVIEQTVTDADGDTATASVDLGDGVFQVQDDGPTAEATALTEDDVAVVDESSPVFTGTAGSGTDGVLSATINLANNFVTPAYGADGPGSVSYALVLTGDDVASGLFATDPDATDGKGDEILLNQTGNTITGTANGDTYFVISVDNDPLSPTFGSVTFTLSEDAPIWHEQTGANGTNHDDTSAMNVAAGLLVIEQTVTDADGDTATASVDLGDGVFQVQDDGPTAEATALTEDDVAVVDESSPVFTGTAGSGTDGVLSATINLANNFVTPAYGADGPGSVSYALVLTGDDVASGLFATDPDATDGKGDEILLNQTGNTITGTANGDTYFVISVDNDPLSPTFGSVTFTLSEDAPIWHEQTGANGTNHDDTSAMNVAAGLLVIEQTVTDADGDTATASVDLGDGVFQVQDDGPTAEATALTEDDVAVVDESSPVFTGTAGSGTDGVLSATINLANNFVTPAYGADGPGSVSYALVLTGDDVASGLFATDPDATDGKGDEILLNQTGNTITGTANGDTYFVISVDNDPLSPTFGSVTFTLSEDAPIWHEQTGANGTNHDDTSAMNVAAGLLVIEQTVTDADGDTATASVDLGDGVFQVQDDGPTAEATALTEDDVAVVDESSPVFTGTAGSGTDGVLSATINLANNFVTPAYGADGPGSVSYALVLTGDDVASGLFATDPDATDGKGDEILLNQTGNTITGTANGDTYFVISVDNDPLSPTFGSVTFTLSEDAPIWHEQTGANGTNHDDTSAMNVAAGLLVIEQTVTDADGDTATASVDLGDGVFQVQDDGPTAEATALTEDDVAVVDESSPVFTGTAGSGTDGVLSATINLANNFVTPAYGADGPGSVSYALVLTGDDVASGLFATDPDATDGKGDEILLNQTGNTITGTANGDTYFVISVDNDPLSPTFGSVTFTLSEDAPIWHEQTGANGTNHDDTSAMNVAAGLLVIEQTVTDADGDTATASVDLGDGVFQVQDDGPTAEATALTEDDVAVVDESSPVFTGTAGSGTDGVLSATINLANNFVTPAYGADGPGSVSYALVLTGDDVASGLFATDPDATDGKGDEILLNQTGNTITGTANGDTYFVISVDNDPLSPTFGSVTFTLSEDAPIWHEQTGANGTNHDDTSAMNVAAGLLVIEQTVTDADGDTATASVDLSDGIFAIQDDGPSITVSLNAGAFTVDESIRDLGGDFNFDDENGKTDPFGYGRLIGYNAIAVLTLLQVVENAGADGLQSSDLTLTSSTGGTISGVDSLLNHTATGNDIILDTDANGVIIGRDSGTLEVVFAIGFDGLGNVVVAQYSAVVHGDTTNPDDAVNLNSFVYVTASITDGDGDTATDTTDTALQITFEDDGPSLGTFTSGIIPNETGTVNGFFGVDFGTDGYHATNAFDITGPTIEGVKYVEFDNADGSTTLTAVTDDANETPIFSLTVRADGTYTFELIEPDTAAIIPISFAKFSAGGPVEQVSSTDLGITTLNFLFDGLFFTGADGDATDYINDNGPNQGSGNNSDDINVNGNGFGIGSNSAVSDEEGFAFSITEGADSLKFDLVGISNNTTISISYATYDGPLINGLPTGNLLETGTAGTYSANGPVVIDPIQTYTTIIVRFDVVGQGAQAGALVQNFSIEQTVLPENQELTFRRHRPRW